jgi:hypothetical protein
LFSHFITCGVWEAVYIIDGLLKNTSDIQRRHHSRRYPRPIHPSVCLGSSVRDQTYALGQVVRTVFLLQYISDQALRQQIAATTNKIESFNVFCKWPFLGGGGKIASNDPVS